MRAKVALLDKATGARRDVAVAPGEPIAAAEGLRYELVDYQEDFSGLGPAVQVVRAEQKTLGLPRDPQQPMQGTEAAAAAPAKDAKVSSFWVFARAPDFDRDNRDDRFAFVFDRLAPVFATGLQIASDPSTPVVYTGCFLLFLGIGIAFYTSHKRVWARLAGGELSLGGAAHRNAEAFASEFETLCEQLGVAPPARPEAPKGHAPALA
jgi:cytochrome c biogenesis protein ResB